MLSFFDQRQAAHHRLVDKVVEANAPPCAARAPEIEIDGELQARCRDDFGDRTIESTGVERCRPRPTSLIFPDLQSGNIAYKLTERLAGANRDRTNPPRVWDAPANDLSRGFARRKTSSTPLR